MNLFLCDTEGTYKGLENREKQLNRFICNLSKLNEMDETTMIFSFVSSESKESVRTCVSELHEYLTDDIKLGIQYSNKYKFNKEKTIKTNMISKLDQCIDAINRVDAQKVYFADDSIMNQVIVIETLKIKYPNIDIVGLNPSDGIKGLNFEIENYISKHKKVKSKKLIKEN